MAWRDSLPPVRGKLLRDEPLAPFTWFRVGGPADVIFVPADEEDLSNFLRSIDPGIPVVPVGVGSNLLVRDGGVDGIIVRLTKPFAVIEQQTPSRISAGAGALDSAVARASAKAGITGLEFLAGIPGTIGGAVAMNAGCYGSETRDVCVWAIGWARNGDPVVCNNPNDFTYRHGWGGDEGVIVTRAEFEGAPADPEAVAAKIAEITSRREQTQPIREKTGGSTFKNPPGHSSWKLVDEAGWRGKLFKATGGGAMFSELHSNFMINPGEATAADIEGLGDAVRADVQSKLNVNLEWEIKRIGRPL